MGGLGWDIAHSSKGSCYIAITPDPSPCEVLFAGSAMCWNPTSVELMNFLVLEALGPAP